MKRNILLASFLLSCVALCFGTDVAPMQTGASFKGPVGLQLYSLRDQFKQNVAATLDQVSA